MTALAQKSQYERDGYVYPLDVLTAAQVAVYRQAFDALEAELGKNTTQIALAHKERDYRFIWEMATEPALIAAVARIYGDDLICAGTHFFCKYPAAEMGREAYVAWHQDVTYWGFEPAEAITAWVAVDDADAENGAMVVIPGSHLRGALAHTRGDNPDNLLSVRQEVAVSAEEEATAATLVLRAGQMSLHDGKLIHGSHPNRSTRRRCGLTVRFMRPNVFINRERTKAQWRPVLVHGEDRYGLNELSPVPTFD